MITRSRRERSAFRLERDPASQDLSSRAATIARPVGDSVTLICPFLIQKEVLYPVLSSVLALPTSVLRKIRMKCGCKSLQGCSGQEHLGILAKKYSHYSQAELSTCKQRLLLLTDRAC